MSDNYPRDMIGYGRTPPDPQWPAGAKIALQFVINYEEGSEYALSSGDGDDEVTLTEDTPQTPINAYGGSKLAIDRSAAGPIGSSAGGRSTTGRARHSPANHRSVRRTTRHDRTASSPW